MVGNGSSLSNENKITKVTLVTQQATKNSNIQAKWYELCLIQVTCMLILAIEIRSELSLTYGKIWITGADFTFTDLSLFWGLCLTQSNSWLSLSLFVKFAAGFLLIET